MSKNPDDDTTPSGAMAAQPAGKADREARLAEALRANLRRRKTTTRRQKTQDPKPLPGAGNEVTDGQS